MPLSPECIEQLRALDGKLGSVAMQIDAHAGPGATHRLPLGDAAKSVLVYSLGVPASELAIDNDCKDILKGLEPKIGMVVASIAGDHPVDVIRGHLDVARGYLRSSHLNF